MGRSRQYLIAVALGLAILLLQCWRIRAAWGLDFANPKSQLMQAQLFLRLGEHPDALFYLFSYVVVAVGAHVGMTVLSLFLFRNAISQWRPLWLKQFMPGFLFMLLVLLIASFWNRLIFPMSRVFEDGELLMVQPASPLLLWGGTAIVLVVTLTALANAFIARPKLMSGGVVVFLTLGFLVGYQGRGEERQSRVLPDIIVLGVDSLRPDFLPSYGFGEPGVTPHINREMARMVVFDDALTPLARTFVSYTSVLTGKNPIKHGVRFNLYPRSKMRVRETLASRLSTEGYRTMLAIDESRFANFEGIFGFDTVIAPEEGALDFIVGSNYDLLATNFLLKLTPTAGLFPHVWGNRAAYRTYQAGDHPRRVAEQISRVRGEQPLFLVSHLCLPHWPYLNADVFDREDFEVVRRLDGYVDSPSSYLRALRAVDGQFEVIMGALKRSGRLDNAIVVVLSDHGEGFQLEKDAFRDLDEGGLRRDFFGHGAFALSDVQYRTVLGMQRYLAGKPVWRARTVQGDVSLIDIAPTISGVVFNDAGKGYEGISLEDALEGRAQLGDRYRFVESGIRSAGVERASIDESKVANEMAYLYRIEPDLRFEVDPALLGLKLSEKQRGVYWGHQAVAVMPPVESADRARSCWLLADYAERTLKCVEFPAVDPVVASMQYQVCDYFANDEGFDPEWCKP